MPYVTVDYPFYILEATKADGSQYSITLKVAVESGPFAGTTPDQVADGLRDFLAGLSGVSATLEKHTESTASL
jgi:hypothetical protein